MHDNRYHTCVAFRPGDKQFRQSVVNKYLYNASIIGRGDGGREEAYSAVGLLELVTGLHVCGNSKTPLNFGMHPS